MQKTGLFLSAWKKNRPEAPFSTSMAIFLQWQLEYKAAKSINGECCMHIFPTIAIYMHLKVGPVSRRDLYSLKFKIFSQMLAHGPLYGCWHAALPCGKDIQTYFILWMHVYNAVHTFSVLCKSIRSTHEKKQWEEETFFIMHLLRKKTKNIVNNNQRNG